MAPFLRTLRPSTKSSHTSERGAALVEFAVVLPLLIMLLIGIWTTARAYNVNNTIDHAVRESARYGATADPWNGAAATAVRTVANSQLTAASIPTADVDTVCIELIAAGATGCGGAITNSTPVDQIYVQLEYPDYQLDFVFFSMTVDLNATAVSRWEG